MGSVGPPPSSGAQLGSNTQSPGAAAPVQPEDDSFASTNPSFRQQTSRLAVVHAMVQHEQDTAQHRKKARAKERGGTKIHPVQKSILEPHQSQGLGDGLSQGQAAAHPSEAGAVRRPGDGASMTEDDPKTEDEDEDDLAALMNRMDIDEAGSEPGLSESATTVSRGTPIQSPTTVHANASVPLNRSPKSPTPWRPPVNYLSKPATVKHDQSVPSLSSPPTSPHRPSIFARRPNFGPPQRPMGAAPAFTPVQSFPQPGQVQLPPVQPLMSPFTSPPARVPIWTPQPSPYYPSSPFPAPMPMPGAPAPSAFPHFGPQAPIGPPGAVDPHAPEFVPRWKMDSNQRFSGRARPFQRLLEDYQRVQGGQQDKQLQLQLALQLQTNAQQDALQNAPGPAPQGGSPMQTEDPARRLALQRALEQAMSGAPFAPVPAAAPPPVDEERRLALQNALQRAMANQPPVTPPQQHGTVHNWQYPGSPFSQTPQQSPQRFPPPSPGPFAPPSPSSTGFSSSPSKGFPSSPSKGFPSSPSKGFPPSPSKGFP